MNKTLAKLLSVMVEIVQNHGSRIESLEREEFHENADDASLMEELTSLLGELQTPELAESIPSDQM
jgi:hypothetical protein